MDGCYFQSSTISEQQGRPLNFEKVGFQDCDLILEVSELSKRQMGEGRSPDSSGT